MQDPRVQRKVNLLCRLRISPQKVVWNNGVYAWNEGYWGPQIGFYGGINYGFGYTGVGYEGGYWRGRDFYYNRSVNNVNVTNIRNVYNKTVVENNRTRVSYSGGTGGVHAQPTAQQLQARNERHIQSTPTQQQHVQQAARDRQLLARNNNGKPPIAATARPADFKSAIPAKAPGGRVNRAALTANAKIAAPKANAASAPRPSRAGTPTARGGANAPKPPTVTARTRTNSSGTTARNVPKPPNASSAPSRTGPETNARVNAPPARRTSPAAPARPSTSTSASSRPARTSPGSRSMGMPQSEGAPRNPAPESHSTSRPSGPSARESAPPKRTSSHAPQHSQASHAAPAQHHESGSRPDEKTPH